MKLFVFAGVFVFVKVVIVDYWGRRIDSSYPTTINVERLMCEVEFLGGVFFWNKVRRLV